MKSNKFNEIKKIFDQNNGYARTKEILQANIHSSYIYSLLKEGKIDKLKRGLYKWNYNDFDTNKELVEINKIVPNGVICLFSALSYYKMSTYNPWEYHIAIHRDSHKPKLPDYPPISIFYFSEKQFNLGISEITINNTKIKIYDKEKTICDCIRLRNKVGIDIVKEALENYLKEEDKNISKLIKYAEITGIKNLLKRYLEVLI